MYYFYIFIDVLKIQNTLIKINEYIYFLNINAMI